MHHMRRIQREIKVKVVSQREELNFGKGKNVMDEDAGDPFGHV